MTVSYNLRVKRSAEKELRNIPKPFLAKLIARISALSKDPRPQGCEALAGSDKHYRVRQNDYRIVYTVDDIKKEIIVVKIGHRSDIYR
jgi:mRNA interferase RelE/StbE